MNSQTLDLPTLESWPWDAACSIRGAINAPKYKEYILPLLFYKRLSDVYADEVERITREIGKKHQNRLCLHKIQRRLHLRPSLAPGALRLAHDGGHRAPSGSR
jgi:type I restriction-modification system DNA methylase subunit